MTMYTRVIRPLLFLLPPDVAHTLGFAALAPVERFRPVRAFVCAAIAPARDERLVVRAMGLEFPNPIGLAAGFDKNARRPRALAALGFGHLEIGTVTAHPQAANPEPNLFRLPADRALVNRLGFPNDGADRVAARLRAARGGVNVPVGVSIGKSRVVPADDLGAVIADYVASFDAVSDVADFVVVNVSSPNTAGLRAMQASEHARALLGTIAARAAARSPSVPLLVKIAPDLADAEVEDLLAVIEETGVAGVVATNTTVAREGLASGARSIGAVGAGGLSGPPLRRRALEVVRRARARLGRKAVVVGVGGVERAEHAMSLVRAGADLVQTYTGFVYEGPGAAARMTRGLAAMMDREGVRSIAAL
ncbi:MAG TPA: quinone-dependent dihydroorotate dehydrogenase, partial [Polyangiaceae bacterium]|nr:quinone-dependent dihydroorotate dehydrogenase [Polyangiaceae bacterium]